MHFQSMYITAHLYPTRTRDAILRGIVSYIEE